MPHDNESDFEHRRVSEIARFASRLAAVTSAFPEAGRPLSNIPEKKYYEIWEPIDRVKELVDITRHKDVKRMAIACYRSQMKDRNYSNLALGLNMYRAAKHLPECEYVEAFA